MARIKELAEANAFEKKSAPGKIHDIAEEVRVAYVERICQFVDIAVLKPLKRCCHVNCRRLAKVLQGPMSTSHISYKRHCFPPEIISHAVWHYARFNLSLREVEEILLKRWIDVSYENIRRWIVKFGLCIARNLRRRQVKRGDIWHLDEVRVEISGRVFWLWRAVDQDGMVLDEILQSRRDTTVAKQLLKSLSSAMEFLGGW